MPDGTQIILPACKSTFISWKSKKWCGFVSCWDFLKAVKTCWPQTAVLWACVPVYIMKEDHMSWYWQRNNLIQFRQLRQTMSLHVKPNKLQGGNSTRAHVCAIRFRRLHKVVCTVMVLYCKRSSCITARKKKKINVTEKLRVCEYLSSNLRSRNLIAPLLSKQPSAADRKSNLCMSWVDPHKQACSQNTGMTNTHTPKILW